MFCEGYLEPHDTGEDNPESVHPNFEFCEIWMTYLEDCILPNATLIEGYGGGYSNLIMQWAQFQYYFPEDFDEAIADSEGCGTTTSTLPPAISEECRGALNDFEKEYGFDLTIAERKAILFGIDSTSCGEGFDDKAFYIINCVTKSNDYITVLNNTANCDGLEPPLSMSEDCKKLSNILDLVVGDDATDPHCGLLKDLGSSKHDIQYLWDCDLSKMKPRNDGTFPLGQTDNQYEIKTVKVYFSPAICDEPCIKILSTVIHESIHAKMESMALDKLPILSQDADFPTSISFQEFQDAWNEIRTENFNGIVNKHIIMAEYYTEQYAKAMYDMVGIGKWEDYLYWAYDGLGVDPPLLIGNSTWESHKNNWNSIKDNINLNCE